MKPVPEKMLPADSEADGDEGGVDAAGKHMVIAGFREDLGAAGAKAESDSGATVHAAFINALRADDLIGQDIGRIKAKPRIECGYGLDYGLRELNGAVINAAAAGDIDVDRAFAIDVNLTGSTVTAQKRVVPLGAWTWSNAVRLMSNWLNMKSSIRPTRLPETPAPAVTFHP